MIDIKKIRDNLDEYKIVIAKKKRNIDVNALLDLDDQRKNLQKQIDDLKFQQKKLGEEKKYEEAKALKGEIQTIEESYKTVVEKFDTMMLTMPNFIAPTVPEGKDDSENVVVKTIGDIPTFDFESKDHMTLMKQFDMVDVERGVKLAWARSYFLKNDGMLLEQAVLQYALQKMVKKWFSAFSVPNMVNTECLVGTGYFPGGEEDAYRLERDDQWMIATAEIPITAYHMNEVLSEDELPKKYVGLSPCYRREAGTYGKDTAGLYRVHQFMKVEQVVLLPEDLAMSDFWHQQILQNSMELLDDLKIPYRLLQLCTWDLSLGKYNSHDIECWMPSRNSYGETHSATSFLDFQARRLNIRYRDSEGKIKYCYTLNNTVVASPRILIALIENYQQADGSIKVPEVLVPFIGKEVIR
jgi:seryl-tRNA synthetase